MGKFQSRSPMKRRYGRLLKLLELNLLKTTELVKASDFASRDTQDESSVRSRHRSPPPILSGRVEFIDENGCRSAFACECGNKKETKSYLDGRRFLQNEAIF
jgi:hypothetical protein